MFRNGGNRPCAVAGGASRLLAARRDRGQFDVAYIDQNDDAALSAALDSSPSLVLIETPSNPLLRIFDIRAIAARAKAAGAKVAVDNTFLSPALQRPIVLGADFVIHSTTKFLNGHSDVIGGAVIAADKADVDALSAWANLTGVMGAPFNSYMTLRGLRAKMVIAKSRLRRAQLICLLFAALCGNGSCVVDRWSLAFEQPSFINPRLGPGVHFLSVGKENNALTG